MSNQPNPVETLQGVYAHTQAVMGGVSADNLERPTPCSEWNVRELVNHTIGVVHGIAAGVAGDEMPAGDPPDFTAGNDVAGEFAKAAARSLTAWSEDGVLDRVVQVGPGMPGSAAIGVNLLDTLTHAWDLAEALGTDRSMDPAIAEATLGAAQMIVNEDLREGRFGPAIAIADDAPAHDRLAAFLGREPS